MHNPPLFVGDKTYPGKGRHAVLFAEDQPMNRGRTRPALHPSTRNGWYAWLSLPGYLVTQQVRYPSATLPPLDSGHEDNGVAGSGRLVGAVSMLCWARLVRARCHRVVAWGRHPLDFPNVLIRPREQICLILGQFH